MMALGTLIGTILRTRVAQEMELTCATRIDVWGTSCGFAGKALVITTTTTKEEKFCRSRESVLLTAQCWGKGENNHIVREKYRSEK
jgi:hypothetical protein